MEPAGLLASAALEGEPGSARAKRVFETAARSSALSRARISRETLDPLGALAGTGHLVRLSS